MTVQTDRNEGRIEEEGRQRREERRRTLRSPSGETTKAWVLQVGMCAGGDVAQSPRRSPDLCRRARRVRGSSVDTGQEVHESTAVSQTWRVGCGHRRWIVGPTLSSLLPPSWVRVDVECLLSGPDACTETWGSSHVYPLRALRDSDRDRSLGSIPLCTQQVSRGRSWTVWRSDTCREGREGQGDGTLDGH